MDGERNRCPLPSGLELSELDAIFRDTPHARLDQLRGEAPRYFDPASDGMRLFLTRHADVRATLSDRTLTRDAKKAPSRSGHVLPGTLVDQEGADHQFARMLIARAFDTRGAEARRPAIEAIVREALEPLKARSTFDGMIDYAALIPIRVMTEIFGLPQDNLAQIRQWSEDAAVLGMHPKRTSEQNLGLMVAVGALQNYLFDTIAARRAEPRDDVISDLVTAQTNGRLLRDDEIVPLVIFGLIAGSLTTTDLIGNLIVLLLQHPEQRALLRANPDLICSAVDEALRIEPPVSAVARHASEERAVFGCPMRQGGTVKSSLLAANHDPEVFADPHDFRVDRGSAKHLSFGGGAHGCVGAGLARLEAKLAIEALFAAFPDLHFAEGASPPRKTTYGFRGYSSIPLSAA